VYNVDLYFTINMVVKIIKKFHSFFINSLISLAGIKPIIDVYLYRVSTKKSEAN